jgi:hypothetical protein
MSNYDHKRVIHNSTTQQLLDTYRQHPTIDVQTELEARGVHMWAHGLQRLA